MHSIKRILEVWILELWKLHTGNTMSETTTSGTEWAE